MRVILIGGVVGASLLAFTTVVFGFAFGAFDNFYVHPEIHRPFPAAAVAMFSGLDAGVIGFVYGMPLGYAVNKLSQAKPTGNGYLQAGLVGALAGLVISLTLSVIYLFTLNVDLSIYTYYLVSCLIFVAASTPYSLLAALAIRFFSQPVVRPRWIWPALALLGLGAPAVAFGLHNLGQAPPSQPITNEGAQWVCKEGIGIRIGTEDSLVFSYGNGLGYGAYDPQVKKMGEAGTVFFTTAYPHEVSVKVAWPESRAFEIEVNFDTLGGPNHLVVDIVGFKDVKAILNENVVSLPADLPPGKHRLIIEGRCP